jgi:hypothetical protein
LDRSQEERAMGSMSPIEEAMFRDLDIQWRDHWHMRDQTWKTVQNSLLLFLGVVGLELKGLGDLVMVPAYLIVVMMALFGFSVARHHRLRQDQKFRIIEKYESDLGIYEKKRDILHPTDARAPLAKVFTGRFIQAIHLSFGVVGILLLLRRLLGSA